MINLATKIQLTLFLIFIAQFSSAQDATLGVNQKIAYGFDGVFPVGKNSFFVKHYDKGTGTKVILSHYTNFTKDATTGTVTNDDCGVLVIDNKLYLFEVDKDKNVKTVLAKQYGEDCKLVGDPKPLLSYEITSTTIPKEKVRGRVVQSENGEFFAVVFRIEHQNKLKFGFKVFDKGFNQIREGFFESPYTDVQLDEPEKFLSNEGELFFICFSAGQKIWKLMDNEFHEVAISSENETLTFPKLFTTGDGKTKFASIGQMKGRTEVELVIGELDFEQKQSVIHEKIELDSSFIQFNGKYGGYRIPNIMLDKQGNTIVILEQFLSSSTSSVSNGVRYTSPLTTYLDIKVLKLDKKHELVWTTNLGHGNQISYFGTYQKTFLFVSKEDEYLFFLDLSKTRNGFETPNTFTVSADSQAARDNCLGKISVNAETGELSRKLLCDQMDCNWPASALTYDIYNEAAMIALHKGIMNYRFGIAK